MPPTDDFRETLYTIDDEGHRRWVYSNTVDGRFFRCRAALAYLLMAFYVLAPWIPIGGRQAIFLDIADRKFIFFGLEFWATDTLFLMLALGGLGLSLFLFTALLGRVWCGWACPETVFLEFLFRPIERWIEGNAAERRRLDAASWSFEKIGKKVFKHLLCAAAAWVLATTLLAYFVGAEQMIAVMAEGPRAHPALAALTAVLMALLAFQFGWFREQFCTVVCPYARFQSVLMDPDSLTVGYDGARGEPRAKLAVERTGGDCIDCRLCVRVCPTGIDIRNGSQLECIACAQCIDACDSVMEKIDRPRGLIRYDSENGLRGSAKRFFRPRVLVYGGLIGGYLALFGYFLAERQPSEAQIVRAQREAPFQLLSPLRVVNHFEVRLSNKSPRVERYTVSLAEPSDAIELVVPLSPFPVTAGEVATLPLFVSFKREELRQGKRPLTLVVDSSGGFRSRHTLMLLGPDA